MENVKCTKPCDEIMSETCKPYKDIHMHNVRAYGIGYTLGYCGCGHGWIELDDEGFVAKMRYADSIKSDGSLDADSVCGKSANKPGDEVTVNGVPRIFVLFSGWNACIPIPPPPPA